MVLIATCLAAAGCPAAQGTRAVDPGGADAGRDVPAVDPGGEDPGAEAGRDAADPGPADPGPEDPGVDPGAADPGVDPGPVDPGEDPGAADPGVDPGPADTGIDPGVEDPGEDLGGDPGATDPGAADPGDDPGTPDPGPVDPGPVDPGPPDPGVACTPCSAWGTPVTTGTLANPDLKELSGLAASRVHPGVFYAHNDSGDVARFFALDLSGAARGTFRLTGVVALDWEDLAVGPCETGSCVYLGDVGDNWAVRGDYTVYVVPEPAVLDAPAEVQVASTALPFRYPDGSHNSETILVHPSTGDIYVVTKTSAAWGVYRFPTPHTPGVTAELVPLGTVNLAPGPLSTAGSVDPCGTRVLIRNYGGLHLFTLAPGQAFDAILSNVPTPVPVAAEGQGEAVGWEADGLGYVTASEGAGAAIHRVRCL